jgi:hypothetical protein
MKRCAHCNDSLGLFSRRHWSLRFCSLAHKKAYLHKLQQHKRQQEEARTVGYQQCQHAKQQA